MNVKKCTICNIKIDEDNCKKDRNICKNCYNINKERYNNNEKQGKIDDSVNNIKKPKIDNVDNKINVPEKRNNVNNDNVSTYENHRHVVIGPSNVGKTYYMLKILEKIGNKRPIHIITRSPDQTPNFKTSIDIKPINKYEGSIVFLMIYWELGIALK